MANSTNGFAAESTTYPEPGLHDTRTGVGIHSYPGCDAEYDGLVASIRLKNIREGLENYEYFAILNRMGKGAFVKEMIDQVRPAWWDFAQDTDKLMDVRE